MEAKVAKFKFPTTDAVADLQLSDLRATGAHNYTNAAVAAFLVLGLGVGADFHSINSIVKKLTLLPHRIQVGKFTLMLLVILLVYALHAYL